MLAQHLVPSDPHSCNNVGHQLRVYAGDSYVNQVGKVYPSLGTCDTV